MAYLLQIVSLCWHGIMVRVVTLETKTVSLCKSWKDINRAYWLICWKNNSALVFKTISKRLAFITILVVYGLYLLIFTGPRLFFAESTFLKRAFSQKSNKNYLWVNTVDFEWNSSMRTENWWRDFTKIIVELFWSNQKG